MNKIEKDEIAQLPEKYRPLTMWSIIGWSILFNAFGLISFILTWVFAFNRRSINRRSLARVYLFFDLIMIAFVAIVLVALYFTGVLDGIIETIKGMLSEMLPH